MHIYLCSRNKSSHIASYFKPPSDFQSQWNLNLLLQPPSPSSFLQPSFPERSFIHSHVAPPPVPQMQQVPFWHCLFAIAILWAKNIPALALQVAGLFHHSSSASLSSPTTLSIRVPITTVYLLACFFTFSFSPGICEFCWDGPMFIFLLTANSPRT